MSEIQDGQGEGPGEPGAAVEDLGLLGRARVRLGNGEAWAKSAADRHVSIAVPFRAAERNRRVAASVIAGGIAYTCVSDEGVDPAGANHAGCHETITDLDGSVSFMA